MKWPAHGSNPAHLYEGAGIKQPDSIVDFSVNINPYGPPQSIRDQWNSWFSVISDYPDPYGKSITRQIAQLSQVDEQQVVLGNGAAEVIQFLGQLWRGCKVIIVQPAFSEYETACRAYGCEIEYVLINEDYTIPMKELAVKAEGAAAVFICTPNNPSGMAFSEGEMIELLDRLSSTSCCVVVDEAFYDFAGSFTVAGLIQKYSNLIVLRSLTKMYAIAGLRLGYLLANESLALQIARFRPHWNVNALALKAAETILADREFVDWSREKITEERENMFSFLEKEGFQFSRSVVNFYLLRDPRLADQKPLFLFLLEKGIVLRHTYNYPGLAGKWLRAAVKTEAENNQLKEALQQWKKQS
ncbi:threonine-phosphate decarboxylase CobD [Pseudobacillus wudalianchiensis]|uniref:L-threonine-O-3-phosphate decarboxylase n=1 Tax=Pseudobacillus wudalianchiensis TaxID=1743143 RepID=A0A1B9AG39_9BACI|nr:threonine-phosphate decarboxylase CobD [Bacillus wudalianchiensis]OCA82801.1 threonine-phosphate decarboxylase [Bacillus wudalianchiensis]